jgi:hypothetical protein
MYIEFPLPIDHAIRQRAIPRLHEEIRQWAHRHNIDYSRATVVYSRDHNTERLYLRNDRAAELFCISWNPQNPDFQQYRLGKDV